MKPLTALHSADGKLLTSDNDIIDEAGNHYKKVFKHREIKSGLEKHKSDREDLCKFRIKEAGKNKTPAWSVEDVTFCAKVFKNWKIQRPI